MSRHVLSVLLLGLVFAVPMFSEQPSMHLGIEIENKHVVIGAPVMVTASLKAGAEFQLAKPFGPCDGGLLRVIITEETGRPSEIASDLPPCPKVNPPPIDVPRQYPRYQGSAEITYSFWLMPGNYSAQVQYHSEKPQEAAETPYWAGSLKSEKVRFQVEEARGADLQVLKYFNLDPAKGGSPTSYIPLIRDHLQVLLQRFPTSTYAACVIYQRMSWTGGWEPTERNKSLLIGSLETGSFLSNSYPDDTGQSKDGWRSMKGEEAAKWWDKWITIILKNHPDIWFADELRLKRALDQIALKKYDAGAADLRRLAREAKGPVASRSKLILDLIQQKGWIKAETAAPTPVPIDSSKPARAPAAEPPAKGR